MPRWSARRGQIEPLAAIAAVFAVAVGLTVYAGVLDGQLPGGDRKRVAGPTLDRLDAALSTGGVVDAGGLSRARAVAPDGYGVNATLVTARNRWHVGPTPPRRAQVATERVSVQTGPGRVRSGRLTVRVWR